jgi:hypothetical protein
VTAFFVPLVDRAEASEEEAYAGICEATQAENGHAPRDRRIFKLSFRREGADVEAEVGQPDPVRGETVLAILDLGRQLPYVIRCGGRGGAATQIVVAGNVYSVTEFARSSAEA